MNRKKRLLKIYRQKKRFLLLILMLCIIVSIITSFILPVLAWVVPIVIISMWLIHEAWLTDPIFYSPKQDYSYNFPPETLSITVTVKQNRLQKIVAPSFSDTMDTLILVVKLKSTFLGIFFDPHVIIQTDKQYFERGTHGVRYLNLSGLAKKMQEGTVSIVTKYCTMTGPLTLYAFNNIDYSQQRMMIIAPHADDAEIAAFGQYSHCPEVSIITLTQGEIEAEQYQATLSISKAAAAQLKGRLRSWDSVAIPLWGGVPTTHCVQLGYYCMQLTAMHNNPQQAFPSKESTETDTRSARIFNSLSLPSDNDGQATWSNLKSDLLALIEYFKPEVIIMPHPQLDPHQDHVQAALLVDEVLRKTNWQPETQLLYANHLHDNGSWPIGPIGNGIPLPPAIEPLPTYTLWSQVLTTQMQLNKTMALGMQHDLRLPISLKKRLRRIIQRVLTSRQWPKSGENEFFRKAVRRHELFWVKK